ncbi:DNA-binding protein [Jiangella anatolica]|uniref:DNA-binding protein n=2 Tax=Jiangella anatolica TaxID=2670374 RepID=A0A2W2CMU1_9ACTN|nr:DNA-binding protein [Jiangella anatolica]
MPAELTALLRSVLEAVARGDGVTLQTLPDELSTTVAAEQLGVSRPTLMRMIRDGEIAAHKVGTHHRLKRTDVLDFRRVQLQRRRAAFEELRLIEDELGLE